VEIEEGREVPESAWQAAVELLAEFPNRCVLVLAPSEPQWLGKAVAHEAGENDGRP
jgi:hypothetical protein